MAVFRRPGSRYYHCEFEFRGERIRRSTKATNAREARQIEAALRLEIAKSDVGIRTRAEVPTLAGFRDRFLSHIQSRSTAKPSTAAFYEEKFSRLTEYSALANARLDRIDEELIERFIQWRRERVNAVASVNRCLATLRRALRLAHEWRMIDRVPRIRLLPGERQRDFVLSRDQEAAYLEASTWPLRELATLMLDTGLRIGEALALRWGDIDLSGRGYIRIRAGKSRNARRDVALTTRARELLQALCTSDEKQDLVFRRRWLVTSICHMHSDLRADLGLPKEFVVHSFRHTCLTRLGAAGVDAFTLMRIAGHSSVTISQRYVHPAQDALDSAVDRLERMLHEVPTKSPAASGRSKGKPLK